MSAAQGWRWNRASELKGLPRINGEKSVSFLADVPGLVSSAPGGKPGGEAEINLLLQHFSHLLPFPRLLLQA